MNADAAFRDLIARALAWGDAHVSFEDAISGLAPALRGVRPPGLEHSVWELVEHLRLAQSDILEFCERSNYSEKSWPEDYWPATPAPPSVEAWEASLAAYFADLESLRKLATSSEIDLSAQIPHGTGQTYARELMLVIDHTAYHVGQIVLVRQILGAWH
jgi:uncharacterized damage-inducible protein DinB